MKIHKIFILIYLLLFLDNHLFAENEKFNYVSSFGTVITDLEDSSMTGEFLLPYGSLIDDKNEIIYVTDCPSGIINIFDLKGNFIKKLPDNCIHKNGSKNNDCLNLPADINFVKSETTNICTIEDPVEFVNEGINQTQVNVQRGVTFAAGLRSLLRQDPNVILIGEIRDQETAEIAFKASI